MNIGWPTDVQHVAHVTFDRFHGFLGLPAELEPEVPRRPPSASANVFGVSTESMQCSYDSRRNSVPTILLLMQRHLYEKGGLRAEGIFRINAENSQEEYVRDQLNTGVVPDGVDVHCLAGLIKAWFRELPMGVLDPLSPEQAWFRELPMGVLDPLSPEQVIQCKSEDECAQLVKILPSTEAALLDWAINLMADVVHEEEQNKMNAHNVAMVFAPNMTQMADPLTALMYAVQVMNFLKTLIIKTLKERQESALEDASDPYRDPSDWDGQHCPQFHVEASSEESIVQDFIPQEVILVGPMNVPELSSTTDDSADCSQTSENALTEDTTFQPTRGSLHEIPACAESSITGPETAANGPSTIHVNSHSATNGRSSSMNCRKGRKTSGHPSIQATLQAEKSREGSTVSRINSKLERVEVWR